MVGATQPPADNATRAAVLLVGSKGSSCTGVAIARNLVLTAGHCVLPGADYKLVTFDAARTPTLRDTAAIAAHPEFDASAALRHRVTADVALVKLAAPLVASHPHSLRRRVAASCRATVSSSRATASRHGDGKRGGTLRRAGAHRDRQARHIAIAAGRPGNRASAPGLGACTGDSGGPVFTRLAGTCR